MKGNSEVIIALNELLAGELTAIDQYFIHSRMYENWGYSKLFERIAHEVQDETNHADVLIKRILFLEGVPDLSKREPLSVGSNPEAMLKNDLVLELSVVNKLKAVIALCESVQDYQTREILQALLKDTEDDHTHWIEQQLHQINQIGLQNYLQSQV